MNTVLTLCAHGVTDYLLVTSLAAALLISLAWAIIKLARIKAPIYGHQVWLFCLIGSVLLPALYLYGPRLSLAILPAAAPQVAEVAVPAETLRLPDMLRQEIPEDVYLLSEPDSSLSTAPVLEPGRRTIPVRAALALLWFVGFALMMLRLIVGWYRLRQIYLSAAPLSDSHQWGNRKVSIRITSRIQGPVCYGLFRGVILFPRDMYENADAHELEMILKHELAHIVRKDAWINLFQRGVEAVFFFHPFLWYASLQLTQQREQICDNYVLAQGTSATDYTALLAKTVEKTLHGRRLGAVALMEGSLLSRVRFLLNPQRSTQIRLSGWTSIATAVIFLIVSASSTIRLKAKVLGDHNPADYNTRYRIECRLDVAQGLLQGQEIIRFQNATSRALDQLELAWISQGTMRITQQGKAVEVLSENDLGTESRSTLIELAQAVDPGDEGSLLVKFRARSPQFANADKLVLPRWHPRIDWGKNTHSDFQVKLDVPSEYTLATSGVLDEASGSYRAQGVRSFGLFLGKGLDAMETQAGDVSVRCVFPPQGRECAELLLEAATDAIGFYQERLGFYPAACLTIIPGMNRPAGGYPVATNVVAIHGMEQFDAMPELHWQWITAHEIGHQYFGEHVLCKSLGDSLDWLLIGLGIYADRDYVRARNLGLAKHQALMDRYIQGVRAGHDTTINRTPAERSAIQFDFNNVVEHGKSYSVISALDCILGQEVFGQIYRRCLTEYAGRGLGIADFQVLCEDVAEQDLGWFFDQWVNSNRILSYEISKEECERKAGQYLSEIEVKCLGDLKMPVPVTASFKDGSTQTKFTDRHQATHVLEFNSQSLLADARLDVEHQLALVVPPYQAPSVVEQDSNKKIQLLPWTGAGPKALNVFREIGIDTRLNPGSWFKLALTLYDGQYYAEALKAFERTHELAEKGSYRHPASLVWCGHIHDLLGQRDQAIKCYESVLAQGEAFQVRHDQYRLRIDRDWAKARLTTPFVRHTNHSHNASIEVESLLEVLDVRFDPIRQGKNRLWVELKNHSDQSQTYQIDIRTEAPSRNWQSQFLDTVKASETKRARFAFTISDPISKSILIRLRFYKPNSSGEFDMKQPFKEIRYLGGDLAHYHITENQIQVASAAQTEIAQETLQTIQTLVKNQAYEVVWKLFSKDFREAELHTQTLDKFIKIIEMPGFYYLSKQEFLTLEPRSLARIGDVFSLKTQTRGRPLRKTRTVNFVIEAGKWKLDSIDRYDSTKTTVTTRRAKNNLKVSDVTFAPISQGKNKVRLKGQNLSNKAQAFGLDIRAETPRRNWQRQFCDNTLKPGETVEMSFDFEILGPVTDASSIRLRFYNPPSTQEFNINTWFKETRYDYQTLKQLGLIESVAEKLTDPEIMAQIEISAIKIDPIRQGKNVVHVQVRNTSEEDQIFRIQIYTRSPDVGGWGTSFFDRVKAGETTWTRHGCKIRGPITEGTYIRLDFHNPGPAATFDQEKWDRKIGRKPWFKRIQFDKGDLEKFHADSSQVKPASKKDAEAVIKTLQQLQYYLSNGEYESAWHQFTQDFREAEFFDRYDEVFKQSMQSPQRYSLGGIELLALEPKSVSQQNSVFVLTAAMKDKRWSLDFVKTGDQYQLDSISGLISNNWQERLLPLLETRTSKHFDIYYFKDSTAAHEIDQIANEKDAGFTEICRFLGQDSEQRIRMVFFEDGETKRNATGHQGAGWAVGDTIVEIYNEQQKLDPYHETVHVLMRSFGNPPALFNEGFAVYMSEQLGAKALKSLGGGQSSVHQRTRELKDRNEWIPLGELMAYTEIGSKRSQPFVAYPEAASFVKYLIDAHGKDKFLQAYKELWSSDDRQMRHLNLQKLGTIYGMSLSELEKEWHSVFMTSS